MNYLIGIALGLWLVVFPAAVVALVVCSKRRDGVWEDERPTWADDPTSLYDQLVCEQIEKAEGWVS